MLNNPTVDKLKALRLTGMADALKEQEQVNDMASLSFHERLGLLIDREMLQRENRLAFNHYHEPAACEQMA